MRMKFQKPGLLFGVSS